MNMSMMNEDICIFEFLHRCPDKEKLQNCQGDRLGKICKASQIKGDSLHANLSENVDQCSVKYHKSCVSRYLTEGQRLSEKLKRAGTSATNVPSKRTRSSFGEPFNWLTQCFYCG